MKAFEQWYFWNSGLGDAAFNMALDEALLEAMPRLQRPVLRFYGWTQTAASFGYFQRYGEVEQLTALRPLVRRPTGGGIVPHDADWTYSVVFPTEHEWYSVSARDSYCRIHVWIQKALESIGIQAALAPAALKNQPGQCFVGHEASDLLWHARKIAGAAQRRRKDGLLIQGSIQPPVSGLKRDDWQRAMLSVGGTLHNVIWREERPDELLHKRARELEQTKYAKPRYNEGR